VLEFLKVGANQHTRLFRPFWPFDLQANFCAIKKKPPRNELIPQYEKRNELMSIKK
jgi:hypothetical protein